MIRETVREVKRWWRFRHRLQDFWDAGYREAPPLCVIQNRWRSEAENAVVFSYRARIHERILGDLRRRGARSLLEAACGNGLLTLVAIGLGFQVTAFDFSPEAVDRARRLLGRRPGVTVVQASLEGFHVHGTFDVVRCAEGLPCLIDDHKHEGAFRRLADHVTEGGHLVVEEILVPPQDVNPTPGPYDINRLRSLDTYRELASETGLVLVEDAHPDEEEVEPGHHWLVFQRASGSEPDGHLRAILRHGLLR